ncbi:hypothetical protein BCD64_07010 [Nostoc sp. MBR 210]|nr:hypothetical protein BCD64_07010 [Nostoc sp. MBR 210]
MSTQNLLTQLPVNYTEHLLERAIVDAEFRHELLSRPEEFGITKEDLEQLPDAVEEQSMTFVELVGRDSNIDIEAGVTCVSGFTVRCDGERPTTDDGLPPSCDSTCVSGWTILCDGSTF